MRQSDRESMNVEGAGAMHEAGRRLGAALLASSADSLCVALEGELGAGKTTLVGGVLAAAGVRGPVRSPTYTLIEPYEGAGRRIYHLDLYRLAGPDEVEALGIRDLLGSGSILLIEWPSRAEGRLPPVDVYVALAYASLPAPGRSLRFQAESPAGNSVLKQFFAVNPQ